MRCYFQSRSGPAQDSNSQSSLLSTLDFYAINKLLILARSKSLKSDAVLFSKPKRSCPRLRFRSDFSTAWAVYATINKTIHCAWPFYQYQKAINTFPLQLVVTQDHTVSQSGNNSQSYRYITIFRTRSVDPTLFSESYSIGGLDPNLRVVT